MEIKPNSFNIVVSGRWNKAILTPTWTADKIFGLESMNVEFTIDNNISSRYLSDENIFIVDSKRVTLIAKDNQDEILRKSEAILKTLTDTLTHTPVSGLGFNFEYLVEEEEEKEKLFKLVEFSDIDDLAKANYQIGLRQVSRELLYDGNKINFTIVLSQANDFQISFNFHNDADSCDQISDLLTQNKFVKSRDISLNLLTEIYNISLDQNEEVHA